MSRYIHFTKLKHLIFPNGGSIKNTRRERFKKLCIEVFNFNQSWVQIQFVSSSHITNNNWISYYLVCGAVTCNFIICITIRTHHTARIMIQKNVNSSAIQEQWLSTFTCNLFNKLHIFCMHGDILLS
jgi:hypothetical protein